MIKWVFVLFAATSIFLPAYASLVGPDGESPRSRRASAPKANVCASKMDAALTKEETGTRGVFSTAQTALFLSKYASSAARVVRSLADKNASVLPLENTLSAEGYLLDSTSLLSQGRPISGTASMIQRIVVIRVWKNRRSTKVVKALVHLSYGTEKIRADVVESARLTKADHIASAKTEIEKCDVVVQTGIDVPVAPYADAVALEAELENILDGIDFCNSAPPSILPYKPGSLTTAQAKIEFATDLEAVLKRVAKRDKLKYAYAITTDTAEQALLEDNLLIVSTPKVLELVRKLRAAGVVEHFVVGALSDFERGRSYSMAGFGLWLKSTGKVKEGRKILAVIDSND